MKFLFIFLLATNLMAKDRTPLFFSNSLTSTENSITNWMEGITLTYQHNSTGGRLAVLKISGESKSCTITAYDVESSNAVENIYKELTTESVKMKTIYCLTAGSVSAGVVTLDINQNSSSSVKIDSKI